MGEKAKGEGITFLVGAGAEKHYGLPLGDKFSINTLLQNTDKNKEHEALKMVFETCHNYHIYGDNLFKKAFKSSFYNLLQKYKEEKCLDQPWIHKYKYILNNENYEKIFDENKSDDSKYDNNYEKELEKQCIDLWGKIVNYIVNPEKDNHKEEPIDEDLKSLMCELVQGFENGFSGELAFRDNVDFARSLDEKFHTIIDPKKYGLHNYYKIVNYYWHCYFYIVKEMMSYFCKDGQGEIEFEKYIVKKDNETDLNCDSTEKNKKIDLNYEYILRNLNEFTKKLYETNLNENDNSYYHQIKGELPNCSVLTTNYTPFVEKYFENNAYLNGKLKYMEYPELIKVVDATKDPIITNDKNKYSNLFFPFLFGQSYVKPIVHQFQVEEYRKMDEILRNSEKLVILGYNINSDDNHINAYIREFALKKEVYIVSNKDCLKNVRDQLRLNDEGNIFFIKVDYDESSEKIINEVKESLNLRS